MDRQEISKIKEDFSKFYQKKMLEEELDSLRVKTNCEKGCEGCKWADETTEEYIKYQYAKKNQCIDCNKKTNGFVRCYPCKMAHDGKPLKTDNSCIKCGLRCGTYKMCYVCYSL